MSEPAERFALARRGLPLPIASHATLKGAWLPAAARNRRAPEPIRAPIPVPPPAAELPAGDEPWWMEASELVPVNSETTTTVRVSDTTPARTPNVLPHTRSSETTQSAVTDNPRGAPAVSISHDGETNERAESPPAAARAPVQLSPNTPAPMMTTRMREAAPLPTTRSTALASEPASRGGPRASIAPHVDRERDARPVPRATTAPAPNVSVLVLGGVDSSNQQERAPTPGTSASDVARVAAMQAHSVESRTLERIIERMRADTSQAPLTTAAPVRVDIMGGSSPEVSSRTPATADLSSLLAPVKHTAGDIRIDRVAVTVQAPVRQAQSVAASPPTAPTVSPSARAYRNPWASYFARRD